MRSTSSVGHSSSSFAPEDAASGTGDQATSTTISLRSTRVSGSAKVRAWFMRHNKPGGFCVYKTALSFSTGAGLAHPAAMRAPLFYLPRASGAQNLVCLTAHKIFTVVGPALRVFFLYLSRTRDFWGTDFSHPHWFLLPASFLFFLGTARHLHRSCSVPRHLFRCPPASPREFQSWSLSMGGRGFAAVGRRALLAVLVCVLCLCCWRWLACSHPRVTVVIPRLL